MTNSTPTHDEIAAHAYQIYLREGCVEGHDMEHWLQAETELRARATNGNGMSHEAPASAPAERSTTMRATRQEPILPNSVTPATSPIAQVTRSTTPKKSSNKREAAVAK